MSATAHHEAAHAVVATTFGITIDRVWIDAEGNGHTQYAQQLPLPRHRITTTLAGRAGERQFLDAAPDPATWAHDLTSAWNYLAGMGVTPEQAEAMILLADDDAAALVLEHWSAVQAVAAALIDAGELTGEDVARIVGAA